MPDGNLSPTPEQFERVCAEHRKAVLGAGADGSQASAPPVTPEVSAEGPYNLCTW
jgi:hypothetical protein